MTQTSRPWIGSSVGDAGPYSDQQWWDIYRYLAAPHEDNAGVLAGSGTLGDLGLSVTQQSPLARGILVTPGAANVNGTFYKNDANVALSVNPNSSGLTRIDTVVARKDVTAQTIRLAILQGTPAASPVPLALTQTASIWEIPLADITLANAYVSITNDKIARRHQFANAPESIYLYGLQNKSGSILPPGTVVYFDPTNDKAIVTGVSAGNIVLLAGVTVDYVPINGFCRVLSRGIGFVRTTASITRGSLLAGGAGIVANASTNYGQFYAPSVMGISLTSSTGSSGLIAYINPARDRYLYAASVLRNNAGNYTTTSTTFAAGGLMSGVGLIWYPGNTNGTLTGQIKISFSGVGECLAGNFIYFDILDANLLPISGFTNGLALLRGLGAAVPVPFGFSGIIPCTGFDCSSLNLCMRVNAGTGTVYSSAAYPVAFSAQEA